MTSLAHDLQNDDRLPKLRKLYKTLGEDVAQGDAAIPNLFLLLLRATADKVIDLSKDAAGQDEFARAYGAFVTAKNNRAVFDRSDDSTKVQISKLRRAGVLGTKATFDPVYAMDKFIEVHKDLPVEAIKPAYTAFVDFAREQAKLDEIMDEDAMKAIAFKNPPKDKTLEKALEQIKKLTEKLITGENNAGLKCQDPDLITADEFIGSALKNVMTLRTDAEDEAKLEEIYARRADKANPVKAIEFSQAAE
jgi:dephospho-CoA kinase